MKLYVDADACPVTRIVEDICREYGMELTLVCDTSHIIYVDYGEVIVVSKGMDSADFYIVNKVQKNDIVVTGDYGVAAMSLAKGGYPIHFNGIWYTNDNITQMLEDRHHAKVSRKSSKHRGSGPKKRTIEDDIKFRESLLKLIEKVGL